MRVPVSALAGSRRGVALIEFALVLPLAAVLLLGVMAYGQYFLLAHSVQQIANDAARASIAGLSQIERRALADATVADIITRLPSIGPEQVTVDVPAPSGELLTVEVRLDATNNAMFDMKLIPMPDPVIARKATVRLGGLE